MVSKSSSCFIAIICALLISANCASVQNVNIKKSYLDAIPDPEEQLNQSTDGTNSNNFLHSLISPISRGYDNEHDSPYHHYATYTTSSGYDSLTIIALTVFSILGVLLFLQLVGVQTFRSTRSSWLPDPSAWGFRVEDIPDMMTNVVNWIEKLPSDTDGILKRTVRDATQSSKFVLADWIAAYKKDPVEYQYIRKLACQTLGKSQLAQRSVESQIGKKLLSALEYIMEDGSELVETVEDVIGHPEKCTYITFINEDDGFESEEETKGENSLS